MAKKKSAPAAKKSAPAAKKPAPAPNRQQALQRAQAAKKSTPAAKKSTPAAKKSTPAAKSSAPSGSSYNAIGAWGQANQGNPTVQAAANDLFYNAAAANLSTKSAVSYANQMTPIALRYQQASTNIAEAADLRRLGAETSAARGLLQQQGDIGYRDNLLSADTQRYGYDTQLKAVGLQTDAQRYGYDQQLKGVGLQTEAQRYESGQATARTGMETQAQRYGYDQQLKGVGLQTDAQRFESSQATERTGMTNRSDEEKIRISGGEDRKTLTQGTDETLRLRSDARGAIRGAGKSFYG
jgi:hypothetical protein